MPVLSDVGTKLRDEPISQYFLLFIAEMVIMVALTVSSANFPSLGNSVANSRYIDSLYFPMLSFSIFMNNSVIATSEAIPAIGVFIFLAYTVESGLAGSSYAVETHQTLLQKLFLFAHPAVLIELAAYPIAVLVSIRIVLMIFPNRRRVEHIFGAVYLYLFMLLILFSAAILETVDIMSTGAWWYTHLFVDWIPGILVILGLRTVYRKYLKPQAQLSI